MDAFFLRKEMPSAVAEHEAKGKYVELQDGTSVFVRDESPNSKEGTGTDAPNPLATVVMIHGVPASSFLYRKFFDPLTSRGYRAVSFDFPGLGLSDKPDRDDYDYSFAAAKERVAQVLHHDDLQLAPPFHLVIHDIGGPVAGLYAASYPERVRSMTILNTMWDLTIFSKPFPMNLWPLPVVGNVMVTTMTPLVFRTFMSWVGVSDPNACDMDEAIAWVWLLNHKKGASSFLKVMKSFPHSPQEKLEVTNQIKSVLGENNNSDDSRRVVPMHIVWPKDEVSIPANQCQYVQDNFPVRGEPKSVPGRHFAQLESAQAIVQHIHEFLSDPQQQSGK